MCPAGKEPVESVEKGEGKPRHTSQISYCQFSQVTTNQGVMGDISRALWLLAMHCSV